MPIDAARAKSLFLAASDLADAERASFLDRECGGDAELRARVEALLRANDADPLPPEFKGEGRNNIYEGEERGSRFAISPDCKQLAVCLYSKSERNPPIVLRELVPGKRVEELNQVRIVGQSASTPICPGITSIV